MPSFWRICVASTGSSLVSTAHPLAQTGNIAETGRSLRKKRVWPPVLGRVAPKPLPERSRCMSGLCLLRRRSPKPARRVEPCPRHVGSVADPGAIVSDLPGCSCAAPSRKEVASYPSGKVERFSGGSMSRSTKIVATLGPASSDPQMLERMFLAGVDVVRMNFSHGTAEDHVRRAELVREACRKTGRTVGIMGDLQGPKIRIGRFKDGKVVLNPGDAFVLDADCELGVEGRVGLDYKELPRDVRAGDVLLLDDGKIVFEVEKVVGNEVHSRVRHGGVLSNNKGINRLGGGLTAAALPPKDMEDIRTAAKIQADYLAVSFPKTGADMYTAKELVRAAGGEAFLIAKIERAEAVEPKALIDIMSACEGIMVARGDLAVEVGDASVPALQKRMIRLAREQNKLTITATQMMESMISSPVPTRAEVSDVANAVLDGTDAVMLSAETASGKYPVETIASMSRICAVAEDSAEVTLDRDFLDRVFT